MEFELFAHNFESLCRIQTMKAQLLYGRDVHMALQAASHFAFRFFEASVELANGFAQEMHNKLIKESLNFLSLLIYIR